MPTNDHSVVVAGAGPAGMMLAAELALAGVDVAVLEQRRDPALTGSRAGGFQSRTIEVFDQRGIADRFLAEAERYPVVMFGGSVLDITDLSSRHPHTLRIWQSRVEEIMSDWLTELSVSVQYGRGVTGFVQAESAVDAQLADGESLRAP